MSNKANLKAITRHMVKLVGGPKSAAQICGVSETEISYWGNDNHDRFIPLDHLEDLNAAAGDLYLRELARTRGFDLVSVERRQNEAAVSLVRLMAQVSRASGEFEYTVLDAASDGDVNRNEARRIFDHIAPLEDLILHTKAAIS